jgi:hypothetical protein
MSSSDPYSQEGAFCFSKLGDHQSQVAITKENSHANISEKDGED